MNYCQESEAWLALLPSAYSRDDVYRGGCLDYITEQGCEAIAKPIRRGS